MCVYVSVCRNSIGSATTWHWSSLSRPKWRTEEQNEEKKSRRTSVHILCVWSFALLGLDLCGGRCVASILHLYKRRKRNGLLVQVVKQREMLRLLTGNAMGRRRCYSFHSFLLIVQLFECQRAPVCFGPHLKHLASHHSHLPWTWCFVLFQLQYFLSTVDVSLSLACSLPCKQLLINCKIKFSVARHSCSRANFWLI